MNGQKNKLISLCPKFNREKIRHAGGDRTTFKKRPILVEDIQEKISQLQYLLDYYKNQNYINGALVTIDYQDITSKSRRMKRIFSYGGLDPSTMVVGARYSKDGNGIYYHSITYLVPFSNLLTTIFRLKLAISVLSQLYNGVFENEFLSSKNRFNETTRLATSPMPKTELFDLMIDISNVRRFYSFQSNIHDKKDLVVTFFAVFKGKDELRYFLKKLGIDNRVNILDSGTAILRKEQLSLLISKFPFVVAQTSDISLIEPDDGGPGEFLGASISNPHDEPWIGVIDSMFDETCYFNKWVSFENLIPLVPTPSEEDKSHGTKVDNILVDGPATNGWLEDGCGHFRVRHYGVALNKRVDEEALLNALEAKIEEHPEIHVWNISLGDRHGVDNNYISFFGAKLDEISAKMNILFVVSGTNLDKEFKEKRIGAPADSMNSIVVNSVDRNGIIASYSRTGPVLTFFLKPDVCYYGGTSSDPLIAYSPTGDYSAFGTSFAAPWISRKLAYMIEVLGLKPLEAKALLIDSASKWDKHENREVNEQYGYGLVPKNIRDVVNSENDEIKFVISDQCTTYTTSIMRIPVPVDSDGKFHYGAKVTLCYFTSGQRNQGVDYSDKEVDVVFGRTEQKSHKDGTTYIGIDSINKDKQRDDCGFVDEGSARTGFQKWNNTKHLLRPFVHSRPLDKIYDQFWGIGLTSFHRFIPATSEENLSFGLVVTIKRLDGIDASIGTFVHDCFSQDLKPEFIDIDSKIKLREQAESDIKLT